MKSIFLAIALLVLPIVAHSQSHAERMSYHLLQIGRADLDNDDAWVAGESETFQYGPAWPTNLEKPTLAVLKSYQGAAVLAAQPGPSPAQFPNGIEAPLMILASQTNGWGIGIIAADDGTLLTYTDHQSPRPSPEVIAARQAAALAARTDAVAQARVWRAASTNHVASANSVPALRVAVQELQRQVNYLLQLNNVTP